MEQLQLKYFLTVADNQHIAHSAEQLNVSQPAVSLAISRLEQELGVKLFDRVGRNIVLNEYGMIFYNHANKILREEENVRLELEEMKKNMDKHISLAMTSPHLLDGVMLPFIKQYPDAKWKINVTSIKGCLDLMRSGNVDFCVSSPGIWDQYIETKVCIEDELFAAVSKKHHFVNKNAVTLEEILTQRLITLVGDNTFRRSIDEVFRHQGLEPKYHIECDHTTRNILISENQGISITVSSAQKRGIFDQNTRFVPIKGDNLPKIPITMSHMKGRYLTSFAKIFMRQVSDFYQRL
ncbi:MAG: LysR family transcriptional regulator [bacterium]|nr:LysR family transcriptional regulator [bacterium]